VRLGELDWLEGHSSQAAARLEAALDGLAGREPDADVASVAGQLGRFLALNGDLEDATPYVERALALAEALDVPEVLSHSLNTKASIAASGGRTNEARILLHGALEIALEHDLHAAALRAYNNLAWVLEMQDRPREVLAVCDRGVEHARRIGDRGLEVNFVGGSLYTRFLLGMWDEALAQGDALADAAVTFQTQLLILDLLLIHVARGQLAAARALWDRFTEESESAPEDPQAVVVFRSVEAALLRALGSAHDALASAETAFAARDQLGISSQHVKRATEELLESALATDDRAKAEDVLAFLDTLRPGELTPLYRGLRARFRARLSEGPDAWASFHEAEQAYEGVGAPFHLAVTQLEHAESLESAGPSDETEALRAAARAVFERLGATPWLERADRTPAAKPVPA
jgi:tetratricopeptide (TPR) repeat protein